MKCSFWAAIITLPLSSFTYAKFDLNGNYRLRMETLHNGVRQSTGTHDQGLLHRLELKFKYSQDNFFTVGELQDARIWFDDDGTPLGTDDVNTLEPIQAHIGWRFNREDSNTTVKLGRFTQDISRRRFLGRTRYRNTHNSFTGAHLKYAKKDAVWQFILAAPDNRFPRNRRALDGNKSRLDKPYFNNIFYGAHINQALSSTTKYEMFYFGLTEEDQPDLATRNRDIHTVGGLLSKRYDASDWGFELAGAYQWGESRATTQIDDITGLGVSAYFAHMSFGYQFGDTLQSKLMFEFDYATGDNRRNDGEYNRFDTLYGVRRFDFGATNLYGVFARSNVIAPGLRWNLKPSDQTSAFASYRPYWLEDKDDDLVALKMRNSEGDMFIGHQLEARFRWQPQEKVKLEMGAAYLMKSDFFDAHLELDSNGNSTYFYTQGMYFF